jgi:hypothetical protein
MKTPSGHARDVGDEHRDLGVERDVSRRKAGINHRVLEGKAAAQQKCDQIVTPDVSDVAPLVGQLTVAAVEGERKPSSCNARRAARS